MALVYCVTPYVLGESLGVGIFYSEEAARAAQASLQEHLVEEHGVEGSAVDWVDHGWLSEEAADDLAFRDFLRAVGADLDDLL